MPNIFKLLTVFTVVFSGLSSFESGIDSHLSTDILSPFDKTKLDINSTFMQPNGDFSNLVLSPRFSTYMNEDFDLSVGLGIRKEFIHSNFILGYHLFYDASCQKYRVSHQSGVSGELLSDDFDLRINYYHPLKNFNRRCRFLPNPQKWVEVEALWKFESFSAGLVPSYNMSSKHFAVKPKVIIPFRHFVLETGITLSQNMNETSSYVGIGIPLYSMGCKTVSRSSNIKERYEPLPEKKKS